MYEFVEFFYRWEGVEKVGFSRYFFVFLSKTTIYGRKMRVFLP